MLSFYNGNLGSNLRALHCCCDPDQISQWEEVKGVMTCECTRVAQTRASAFTGSGSCQGIATEVGSVLCQKQAVTVGGGDN